MADDYELIDSGDGEKLERFGRYRLIRPCSQAVWRPQNPTIWKKADAHFSREDKGGWRGKKALSSKWEIECEGIRFLLKATDFGHLGIFPEQRPFWKWIRETVEPKERILNLFAYSGGSSLAALQAGASVCHVDASKGMISWAKENLHRNQLQEAPIRWIVEDAQKFVARENRRGNQYEGIILDPPSFGRGKSGEVFKIDEAINPLLESIHGLLSKKAKFVLLSCHTPGYTPTVLKQLLAQFFPLNEIDAGEMQLLGDFSVPSGTFARWQANG